MAQNSNIEWTDDTWNPTVGCSVISPGCKNCYAMRMAARLAAISVAHERDHGGDPGPMVYYRGTTEHSRAGAVWTGNVALNPATLTKPLSWKKPRRIFVNSMSDLFHESLPVEAIAKVFNVMAECPQHTFQILTKRPERMQHIMHGPKHHGLWSPKLWHRSILPNVWLGVSVEDTARVSRIDHLRATPAAVRFISFEPLLEDVGELDLTGIHLAITGGESGPKKRSHDPEWQRNILRQCRAQGVAFFGKQWDKKRPLPDDLMIREVPVPA